MPTLAQFRYASPQLRQEETAKSATVDSSITMSDSQLDTPKQLSSHNRQVSEEHSHHGYSACQKQTSKAHLY